MAKSKLTLQEQLDQLRTDFEAAKQLVVNYINSHPPSSPLPVEANDPNDPRLFKMPEGDLDSASFRDYLIHQAFIVCEHREPYEGDWVYWRAKMPELISRGFEIDMTDYCWKKLIGWQSTGADRPTYGPYRPPYDGHV